MLRKKLLSLGLAGAMVASTGVTAFAASNTVQGNDTETLNSNVVISGSVRNSDGTAPQGKLEVELPTRMSFAVDEAGNFTGGTYEIKNKSAVGINVSVSQFDETNKNGGIKLVPMGTGDAELHAKDRSNVKLYLQGDNPVDLAASVDANQVLSSIDASSSKSIHLRGDAGKAEEETENTVDRDGANEEFNLVFQIKKQ